MEPFQHSGDIVVKLTDTAKKTTYHPAKNVGNIIYNRIIAGRNYEANQTDMFPVSDGANNIPIEYNTQKNTIQACNGRKCASWDVLHPSFKFCVPANYPTNYDQRPDAPLPPNGREINLPIEGTKRMLRAIRLDVKWLQSALIFGHHNVKTRPPGGRTNKRFWTKANLSAYLRSCSCTGELRRIHENYG